MFCTVIKVRTWEGRCSFSAKVANLREYRYGVTGGPLPHHREDLICRRKLDQYRELERERKRKHSWSSGHLSARILEIASKFSLLGYIRM